jgi:alkanesulfonate monooxygenase SsuD/methylene tetrahydromethanopterin reductase-like flavin-dependent oxidoreductase (luciferase family)
MNLYREKFKPSARVPEPYAILAMAVICADTDAEADRLASAADLHFVRRAKGEYLPLASPEEAAAYPYSETDRARIVQNRKRLIVGGPDTVRQRLQAAISNTHADELMITTMMHSHEARKHSYGLLAEMFAMKAAA